jgi:hypothetical protein
LHKNKTIDKTEEEEETVDESDLEMQEKIFRELISEYDV